MDITRLLCRGCIAGIDAKVPISKTASMWSVSPVSPRLSLRETSAADPSHFGCCTDRTPTPDARCRRTDFDLMCPILVSYRGTPHMQPPCSLRRSILPLAGHPRSLVQLPYIVEPWPSLVHLPYIVGPFRDSLATVHCISILSNDGLVSLGIIDSHSQARSRHAAARIATGSFTCHVPERPGIPMAGDNQTASPSRRNPVKDNVPSGEIFLCPRPAYRRRPARLPGAGGTWLSELPAKKTIPRDVRASRKESGPSAICFYVHL